VGKTTYAKALAGSCRVPLIAASLGQWQSAGHLGDTLKAMRETFERAKAAAPAILFIDEIDSFGNREGFNDRNKDYSIQVVNSFLEQLDGVEGREGVVVVGAANHANRIDSAIIRSGRLDRAVWIGLPDRGALSRILRYHLRDDLAEVDLLPLATLAVGGSGADCERWVRGARRKARTERRAMIASDLEQEIRGAVPRITNAQRRRRAVHEAGHAVAAALAAPSSLLRVSIQQIGHYGGGVAVDYSNATLDEAADIDRQIVTLLAGRAAEEVVVGNVSAGAGGDEKSDLAKATQLAGLAVSALGLGQGDRPVWAGIPVAESLPQRMVSDPAFARQVGDIMERCYRRSKALITEHLRAVEAIAARLEEVETIEGEEAVAIVEGTKKIFAEPPEEDEPHPVSFRS
jgi:ATP-dependent Zn protease